MRGLVILVAALLAVLSVLPAQAKRKPSADPGAQVCEIDWKASFGKVNLKQSWSGAGELTNEELSIRRDIPANADSNLVHYQSQYRRDGHENTLRRTYLSLGGTYSKDKKRRLIIAMPTGAPMVFALDNGSAFLPISDAQLARLVEAKQRLTYRIVKVDQSGAEVTQLAEGWFDLSGFDSRPMAGLPETAEHARSNLAQARKGPNPPCAMAHAAEMNAMDSDEATRRWLTFDCREGWDSPLGAFELRETGFSWRPRPRDSVVLAITGGFRASPPPIGTPLLTGPVEPERFGQFMISFGLQNWGENYRSSDPALRERQSAELRRGKYAARHWLARNGGTGFSWYEYGQILAGEGDLEISAYDKVSEAVVRSTLPWADVLAAEAELQAGRRRMDERERDPMTRCKAVVDEELGMEQIIVT
jgi:hypothetical protein